MKDWPCNKKKGTAGEIVQRHISLIVFFIFTLLTCADSTSARQVAANWQVEKSRVQQNVKKIKTAHVVRVKSCDINYIINYPAGGWSIVAAEDVAIPVIAYSPTGSFAVSRSRPPQFDQWMTQVQNEIDAAITSQLSRSDKAVKE